MPQGGFQTQLIGHKPVAGSIGDSRISGVIMTGPEAADELVASAAGKALKKSVLELGGSDPFIVLEDADVKTAATVACRARNQNNGQSCIAANRFIVAEQIADEFEELFSKPVAAHRAGDPTDRANQVGPLARPDPCDDRARPASDP